MTDLKMTKSEFKRRMKNVYLGVAIDIVAALARRCPVDNGSLRQSIHYAIDGERINIVMLKYGLYVEFGTQPHEIRPVNAKALKFKVGGNDVFAKVVQHPGTRPQPFIRNMAHQDLPRIVNDNIRRHLLAI